MAGGHLTKDKLKFIADSIKTYNVDKVHLTTCQAIQLHNLQPEAIYGIMEGGLDHGIVTMGGGGDFPRNVTVSPLSGVQKGEYFNVLPYAEAAGEYLMTFIKKEVMPRKLKVGFSNGPANETHATFRDLGFVAREDGNFDVYSAGGLGNNAKGKRVIEQKQEGLYAVAYHPFGGCPKPEKLGQIYDVIKDMDEVEARISPDETMYIINLTGDEAKKVLEVTNDGAETLFETSVSCIGATICQVGLRDSQGLLHKVIKAEREAGLKDGSLPKIHISGCMSSCGTHQIGEIGFHGSMKVIDKVAHSAFVLHINGSDYQGKEVMGEEVGTILEEDIPKFLVKLGHTVESEGLDYAQWNAKHPEGIKEIAKEYLQ